jgi:hypothetical protein
MKKILFTGFLFLMIFKSYGQINMNDSTVQAIGYWDKGEKQTYYITQDKYKIKGADTTKRSIIKYYVDVTVVDSTENSYIIDWFYRDFDIQSEDDKISKALMAISEDMTMRIKTDEMGSFEEVVNWEEIRDHIQKALSHFKDLFKEEYKVAPKILDNIIIQTQAMFSTKENIEAASIQEIQQFYTFHGAVYKLGEKITGDMQLPNIYGGKPFNAEAIVWLDEINEEDDNYTVRYTQIVNEEELGKAALDYASKLAKAMGVKKSKLKDLKLPPMKNEVRTSSCIHNYGWVIYSVQTKEITIEGMTGVDETIIELQ